VSVFSEVFQAPQIEDAVMNFPAVFAKAQSDWAKFKAGYTAGLFTPSQIKTTIDWYKDFPKLWETIRPNFEDVMAEKVGQYNLNFVPNVDAWLASIGADPVYRSALGFLPVLVGAVLIVGGVAAGVWALGYIKQQNNLSAMIDGVVAGKIPASVLDSAIAAEQSTGVFSGITGLVKWLAVGAALWFLAPPLIKMFQSRQAQHA
jgi:hypothetical protein